MKQKRLLMICVFVPLSSFLMTVPMYALPPDGELIPSTENETNYFSVSEVEQLIDELSETAKEAVAQAAAEAAKAASIAAMERAAEAEARVMYWTRLYRETRQTKFRHIALTGLSAFVLGAIACGIYGSVK